MSARKNISQNLLLMLVSFVLTISIPILAHAQDANIIKGKVTSEKGTPIGEYLLHYVQAMERFLRLPKRIV
ncbi:MAG: hypothetical protein DI598_02450 [Pseudopedobacter saltans]|uniref:Uncharacterized protein n=1 Tax=Pseudopedobacter saltans TaxID=151895 RepID=A0A2W5F6V6_9SPHI|nr:MAG: hypothetical protein DI598_02450 [Pseudopedobacter saltans]